MYRFFGGTNRRITQLHIKASTAEQENNKIDGRLNELTKSVKDIKEQMLILNHISENLKYSDKKLDETTALLNFP